MVRWGHNLRLFYSAREVSTNLGSKKSKKNSRKIGSIKE